MYGFGIACDTGVFNFSSGTCVFCWFNFNDESECNNALFIFVTWELGTETGVGTGTEGFGGGGALLVGSKS